MDGLGPLAPGKELADVAKKLARPLQVNGVPSIADNRERCVRDSDTHLPGDPDKLAIEGAGDK
jgi:hypothetical protein